MLTFCYLHSTSCSFLFNFFASPPLDLIPLDYENRRTACVDLRREALDGDHLTAYPMLRQPLVELQNGPEGPADRKFSQPS